MMKTQKSPNSGGKRRFWGGAALIGVAALGLSLLPTCGNQVALLLTVRGTKAASTFDLMVKDLGTNRIVLKRIGEKVDKDNPTRDISRPGEELKLAVEFSASGNYLFYILAQDNTGATKQFFIKEFHLDSIHSEEVALILMAADNDKDGFPGCGATQINCALMTCQFLDCNDNDASIHPFAKDLCGDGVDGDCSAGCNAAKGAGDVACVDVDGDGEGDDTDCDDNDPCRTHKIKEAKNFCKTCGGADQATFPALPKACVDKLAKEGKTWTAPYCGDGIDQDCSGQDEACITDKDCDCFSPPQDCEDDNPLVNPAAKELCNDTKDNNCDGTINEGCMPCDLDGDLHALPGTTDVNCKDMPKTDPDDYDSGIHAKTTADTGGKEGGTVKTALREFCSYKVTKNSTTAKPVRQRDVDHDGDGNLANKDCPSEACDKDGDGFKNAGCNPPKSSLDCDDSDAQAFPGAPDKCGDGKAQNCVSDRKCTSITDADDDGYSPPLDCNDKDKTIHPWAVEKCDKVDNDCDGLTDEGNPDHLGQLLPTYSLLCNDDNDGECAPACTPGTANCSAQGKKLSGVCACSAQTPPGKRDASDDRVQCSGEDLSAAASARCFGAIQPSKERCDPKDWDCNEQADDPTGANFLDKGKTCGVDVVNSPLDSKKSCVAGTVMGCDLSKTIANDALVASVFKAKGVAFNKNWICSVDTRFPIPEACNGKDDDCDGVLPAKEIDTDKDKFISCSVSSGDDCTKGSNRADLSDVLTGCGDCNEGVASIYPRADELCNNIDDNCLQGLNDDGKDVCPSQGKICCSTQKECRDIQNDKLNCGLCGKICNPATGDRCIKAKCMCGPTNNFCTGGLNCVSAACKCITGGLCNGCCTGNVCKFLGMQSVSLCGKGGTTCKSCNDSNECTDDSCLGSGVCSNPNVPNSTSKSCNSSGGVCYGGKCCTGCVGNSTCQQGNTNSYCGTKGGTCGSCVTTNQCKSASCATKACKITNKGTTAQCNDWKFCTVSDHCSNGACVGSARVCTGDQCNNSTCNEAKDACVKSPKSGSPACTHSGSSGKCYKGACCIGCWWTNKCYTGKGPNYCGIGGITCKGCTTSVACKSASCATGACLIGNTKNGSACTGGKCYTGACCKGCVIGTTCYGGKDNSKCGTGGNTCKGCSTTVACKSASCSTGACKITNKPTTASCSSGNGMCYQGQCCLGCRANGIGCKSGTTDAFCGVKGAWCTKCNANQTCVSGACQTNADAGVPPPDA